MKIQKSLKKHFKSSAGKIAEVLKIPTEEVLPNDIHKLRVGIKKIRALLSVRTSTNKKSIPKKHLKAIKNLYSKAGELRELQLRLHKIQAFNVKKQLSEYVFYLSMRIYHEKQLYKKEKKSLEANILDSLQSLLDPVLEIRKKEVRKFEEKGKKQIKEISRQKNVPADQLHHLRKQLKKQLFLDEALGKNVTKETGNEKLSDALGQWHDYLVLATEINKDLKIVKLPQKEKKLLEKLSVNYLTKAKKLESTFQKGKLI